VSRQQAATFLARLYKPIKGTAPVIETPFTDLEDASDAHRDNIGRVHGLRIMAGTSNTTFSPRACVSRGQTAILLSRLYKALTGRRAPVVETPYTDLDQTYTDLDQAKKSLNNEIGRVHGLKIMTGTSDTTFSPEACTTRQHIASYLANTYRAARAAILRPWASRHRQ